MMKLTEQEKAQIEEFAALDAKRERLEAAEDRSFERYMNGTGSAATARKARSRRDAIGADLALAESRVYRIMDRVEDTSGDLRAFVKKCLEGSDA